MAGISISTNQCPGEHILLCPSTRRPVPSNSPSNRLPLGVKRGISSTCRSCDIGRMLEYFNFPLEDSSRWLKDGRLDRGIAGEKLKRYDLVSSSQLGMINVCSQAACRPLTRAEVPKSTAVLLWPLFAKNRTTAKKMPPQCAQTLCEITKAINSMIANKQLFCFFGHLTFLEKI